MKASTVAANQDFLAIATIDAIKLLADKSGIDSLELMTQLLSGLNKELSRNVAEMVAYAAIVVADSLRANFVYSHNEIEESAAQCHSRRCSARVISKELFINTISEGLWNEFSKQCIDVSNPLGQFYESNIDGKPIVFVEIGNIDRIFKSAM